MTTGGLVHVVNFQMGEYPIGEHYVLSGIRESLYGKFAVNLGVLLPCVCEAEWQNPTPDFVQEHYCSIRSRLSSLAFSTDRWFDLTPDTSTLATTLVQLLDRFGLRFFDQFPDYPAVLVYFDTHGDLPFQNAGRAALEAAIAYWTARVAKWVGILSPSMARLVMAAFQNSHRWNFPPELRLPRPSTLNEKSRYGF